MVSLKKGEKRERGREWKLDDWILIKLNWIGYVFIYCDEKQIIYTSSLLKIQIIPDECK